MDDLHSSKINFGVIPDLLRGRGFWALISCAQVDPLPSAKWPRSGENDTNLFFLAQHSNPEISVYETKQYLAHHLKKYL